MQGRIRNAVLKNLEYHSKLTDHHLKEAGLKLENIEPGRELVPAEETEGGHRRRLRRGEEAEQSEQEPEQEMSESEKIARIHYDTTRDLRALVDDTPAQPAIATARESAGAPSRDRNTNRLAVRRQQHPEIVRGRR